MPSLIEGYNYDIFISYRQKDNKHDGWVTEFVDNLKGELESTFKEEISVYFDINPHDGLLETHDVDESLKEKLKCLVFIPIISRTYCDPKSFAWEHEFKVFVEQASKDEFGLKVKLPNRNVASRVLPVQIHDLSNEDRSLLENNLFGHLRSIEFIYSESGVNRPLKQDDDEKVNLNKTKYRNQINKTANAIEEIITGIKDLTHLRNSTGQHVDKSDKQLIKEEESNVNKDLKSISVSKDRFRFFSAIPVITILIVAAIFLYPRIFNKDKFDNLRDPDGKITIAVLPFSNQTGDTTLNWFSTGISSLLINGLGSSQELAVRDDYTMSEAIESEIRINTADLTPSMAKSIAGKANAQTYITGSFQGRTDRFLILINLVNTETGNVLWTNKIEGNLNSSEYLSMADSLCSKIRNYLEIKALEQVADFDFRDVYPQSAEAYRYFIEGMNMVMNLNYEAGYQSLENAVETDSTFAFASFFLAYTCNLSGKYDMQGIWIKKALANADRIPARYRPWLEMWNSCVNGKSYQDILKYCDQLAVSGIDTRFLWSDLGTTYFDFLQQYPKAVSAFENVIKLNDKLGEDWNFIIFYDHFIKALHKTGDHEREKEIAHMVLEVLPDQANYCYYYMALCALSRGDTAEANQNLRNYFAVHKDKKTADYILERYMGDMYRDAGIPDQAEKHYRKALELNPGYYYSLRALAAFLINENRNVDEGIAICQGLREKYPEDNYYHFVLSDEGWGYYQKGNFKKALECLNEAWEMDEYFNPEIYHRLEAVKKALASQKNNN